MENNHNMQKITTNLWFDGNAEEAANYYTRIFDGKTGRISRYGKEGFEVHHMPEGMAMVVEFEIMGRQFTGLNGGPMFKFNEAISLIINCENQQEIDYYWDKLKEGGDESAQQCGWLKDKFGLSWQVVPSALAYYMTQGTPEQSGRVMNAMMQMKKILLTDLEDAFNG